MAEKYINISLDDPKAVEVAEVLTNSTCKKILMFLAEDEASETDIASKLNLPANTVNYNVKKLISSGLIEKSKKFFWSVKGRRIVYYKPVQKSIVISTKKSAFQRTFPALAASLAAAFAIWYYQTFQNLQAIQAGQIAGQEAIEKTAIATLPASTASAAIASPMYWLWFLLGGIFAVIIFIAFNWKKL